MNTLENHTAELCRAIAEEIRQVGLLVEELAAVLVSDEELALKHIHRLQSFDLVIQRTGESARLLDRLASGIHSHQAIDGVCLEALQDRLRAATRTN
ncbi:hypothetical protein [Alteriqipengyuania lutimaris]|uniref:Uncharacterized protein n=1 Tax=Alteriqipengyuania lutimaris TaxID=1538146 RepID=A0A395LMX4_9SPHN|nr:hypothetical protein [Alteriqipengyuania lutimaris]MBB3032497.1 hypothetical protein [Alteriqipengyuania lutimaris]RDS78368.1 hypothetical protein DL238_12655 [Alteriqipengyuania lutimaris]